MTRQNPVGPDPEGADAVQEEDRKQRAERGDWADEAAQARTLDDPRRRPPHDSAGVPSTGEDY